MSQEWHDFEVVKMNGQFAKTRSNFETITLLELHSLATVTAPTIKPKVNAVAIIPSQYNGPDARNAEVQKQHGRYCLIIADIDEGNHSGEQVKDWVREALGEQIVFWGHSTASARRNNRRWRVLIPLERAWDYENWRDAGEVIFARLEDLGMKLDWSLLKANQISFVPNVPPEFAKNGQPLFYENFAQPGRALGLETFAEEVAALRTKRELNERFDKLAQEAQRRYVVRSADAGSNSLIADFNQKNEMTALLEGYGYQRSPRSVIDWRSPMQTSKSYATRVVSSNGREVFMSLSASDAAAGLGAASRRGDRFGDAFDLFVHFEHAGDFKAALRAIGSSAVLHACPNAGPPPPDLSIPDIHVMPEPFPGVMQSVVDAALETSPKPQLSYATLATLIAMASACNGVYALPSGARLNLYGLGVGGTGTGKDTPQSIVKEFALTANVKLFGEAGSGQGLEDHLVSYGGVLMVVDEISTTLAATCAKNAPAHLKSAEGMYLKLFSASRSNYTSRLLAKSSQRESGRTILHPCVSILGFATPEGLGSALGEGAITSGLLGRMLMAQADESVRLRRVKTGFEIPEIVRQKAETLNVAELLPPSPIKQKINQIAIPEAVNHRLDILAEEFDEAARSGADDAERALLVRSYEKVERIAGVLAVWEHPISPEINLEMVDWAKAFVKASDDGLLSFVRRFMHSSVTHAAAARIRDVTAKVIRGVYKTDRPAEFEAIQLGYAPRSLVMRSCKTIEKTIFDLGVSQLEAEGNIISSVLSVQNGKSQIKVLFFPKH